MDQNKTKKTLSRQPITYLMLGMTFLVTATWNAVGQSRPTPGVRNEAMPADAQPLPAGLSGAKIGDYVELDESIKNERYEGHVDFSNAEIKDIIKAMSKLAGKNFILDKKIENRRITIMSPEPVTKQEAYNAFLSALYANDFTVVSLGKFLKIVEVRDAKYSNVRVIRELDKIPASEEIVTLIYPMKNLDAEEVDKTIRDFMGKNTSASTIPDTNTMVFTDTGFNLRRIADIMRMIDIPGFQERLESIPILYGSAKEIASLVGEILDAQNAGGRARTSAARRLNRPQKTRGGGIISKIVPDERTNSLVVLANERGILELKELISKLDSTTSAAGGNIHVYYCKNAVAEELAQTLGALIGGQSRSNQQRAGSRTANPNTNPNPAVPSTPTAGAGRSEIDISGDVKIVADKSTNALVVTASATDFVALKKVLEKLDLPRRQVYVEGTILELTVTDSSKVGVTLNVAQQGAPTIGGFNPGDDGGLSLGDFATPGKLNGMIAGFTAGKAIDFGIAGTDQKVTINTVTGLIQALVKTGQAQILHQPQILTSDNEDAKILVNNKIATETRKTELVSGVPVTTTAPDKQDVKIELKITPRLGRDNDLVRLKVEQSIDNFARSGLVNGQIDVTQRSANTSVVVRNGDTVVIGGLQRDEVSDSRTRFPILGDLPIIGWLFKGKSDSQSRSNLILFLTPHIINEYSDLLDITGKKIESRLNFGKKLYDPKDIFSDRIARVKKTHQDDRAKVPPQSWRAEREEMIESDGESSSQTDGAYLSRPRPPPQSELPQPVENGDEEVIEEDEETTPQNSNPNGALQTSPNSSEAPVSPAPPALKGE